MIRAENLFGGYANKPIIKGINFTIKKGEFFALLGPNGSGKTTLFKLITGQLPIRQGVIEIAGKKLSDFAKIEKARKVAVLSQEISVSFDYTVEEIISLGRYPHQKGMFKTLSKTDRDVIENVMDILKVNEFRSKKFRTISGGEKQRVLLAKALTQEPDILLLDEPTNHLDIKHTFQMLNQLKEWQRTKDLTIFAILHDLNVASLYADRVALLHEGAFLEVGDVNTLRKEEQLKKVYEVEVKTQAHPTVPKPQLLMTPTYLMNEKKKTFHDSYKIDKNDHWIHFQFEQPIRSISNAVIGNGIQWLTHFSLLNERDHSNLDEKNLIKWMKIHRIPREQTMGAITVGKEMRVFLQKSIDGVECMIVVVVERVKGSSNLGAVHTMFFIDEYLQDDGLLDGFMVATEAKTKATYSFNRETSTSTRDTVVVACSQQSERKEQIEKNTIIKGIEQMVYTGAMEAVNIVEKQPVL